MIQPTVGRVVWFYPSEDDGIACMPGEPLAAMIAGVRSDTCVNLSVLDFNGRQTNRVGVELVQPGAGSVGRGRYCAWMPYQIAQAGILPVPASIGSEPAILQEPPPVDGEIVDAEFKPETDGVIGEPQATGTDN